MRATLALFAVGVGLAAAASTAHGFYGNGAQIVSANFGRLEQGDDATQFAAISADGRYVAIQTRARNFFADDDADPPGQFRQGGIFRFDLATRAIELVADGDFREEASGEKLLLRGAQNPSLSADGRFVAFSTAQRLVPADVNDHIDVYVRDMAIPVRSPGAFDLVSAKDGGDVPASYAPPGVPLPSANFGAEVTRGAAISADGTRVVFRTAEVSSDLPDRPTADTPGLQVFVRDRDTNTTTLMTRVSGTAEPAGGAVGPAGISADGSTVVWTGRNAPAQTRFVNGETTNAGFFYYLWRRIADGPAAPTRRVTGPSDPDDPACPPGASAVFDASSTGPCHGPLTQPELLDRNFNPLPAISADGRTVAFLTSAGPRPNANTPEGLDLYLTRMDEGATRKAATVELTREGAIGDAAASSPIDGLAMSSDGHWLALTTTRTSFVLPALRDLGPRRLEANVRELYVVDLDGRTVERVTRSSAGGEINGSVTADVSISSDGARIAFTAFASNLLFGDANERVDAFVATRQAEPSPQSGGPGGGRRGSGNDVTEDLGGDAVVLPTSVRQLGRGKLQLRVRVPAPGTLTATARGRVTVARGRKARRGLARANRFSRRAARITLTLAVVRRYRGQLRRRGTLPARVSLSFSPSRGGRRLTRTVRVTFRWKARPKARRRTPAAAHATQHAPWDVGDLVNMWRMSGKHLESVW